MEELLRGGEPVATTAVNLAEAIDVLRRVHGVPETDARRLLEPLLGETIAVLDVSAAHAWTAADVRSRHYHRARSPISLADAVLLAEARAGGAIATSDPHVAAAARSEGLAVRPLPDRAGRLP